MKFVIVKHERSNGKYLFTVPENEFVGAGEYVICKTGYGEQIGYTLCHDFSVDKEEARKIMEAFGTDKSRMRPIIGRYLESRFEEKRENDEKKDEADS